MADKTIFGSSQPPLKDEEEFLQAAKQRWNKLGEELKADVDIFNSHGGNAAFSEAGDKKYRVQSSGSGVQLTLTADFEAQVIRYEYSPVNTRSAGAPEGGMLAMRKCEQGAVELYTADERLTPDETRQVLLQPVLIPPGLAA